MATRLVYVQEGDFQILRYDLKGTRPVIAFYLCSFFRGGSILKRMFDFFSFVTCWLKELSFHKCELRLGYNRQRLDASIFFVDDGGLCFRKNLKVFSVRTHSLSTLDEHL